MAKNWAACRRRFWAFFTNSKGEGKIDQIRFGFKTDGTGTSADDGSFLKYIVSVYNRYNFFVKSQHS